MNKVIEGVTVGDVMTPAPVSVSPKTPIPEIKRLFESRDFNTIPVLDERGVIHGTVTKLDLLRMFRPSKKSLIPDFGDLDAEVAEDIMGRGIVDVQVGDPVVKAVDLMLDLNLRSLPVTERREEGPVLVGMVSRRDVLRSFVFESGGDS